MNELHPSHRACPVSILGTKWNRKHLSVDVFFIRKAIFLSVVIQICRHSVDPSEDRRTNRIYARKTNTEQNILIKSQTKFDKRLFFVEKRKEMLLENRKSVLK